MNRQTFMFMGQNYCGVKSKGRPPCQTMLGTTLIENNVFWPRGFQAERNKGKTSRQRENNGNQKNPVKHYRKRPARENEKEKDNGKKQHSTKRNERQKDEAKSKAGRRID